MKKPDTKPVRDAWIGIRTTAEIKDAATKAAGRSSLSHWIEGLILAAVKPARKRTDDAHAE